MWERALGSLILSMQSCSSFCDKKVLPFDNAIGSGGGTTGRCPVPRGAIVNVIDVEVPATKHQGSAEHERWRGKLRNYSLGNERAKTPEREKKCRGGNNMSDMRRPS